MAMAIVQVKLSLVLTSSHLVISKVVEMGCSVHKNGGMAITDETTQAELLELMTDLGITYKTVAYYMTLVSPWTMP
jgi:hypothetical protein